MSGQIDGFFVEGICNSGINFSRHGQLNDFGNIAEGSVSTFRRYLSSLKAGNVNQSYIKNINGSKAKEGVRDILNPMNLQLLMIYNREGGFHNTRVTDNQWAAKLI